ncbi:YdcH family protein [Neptunicoccus sediminis]|uniref:YdcH family protein n=1 Tax=Neptunicoccus sediminis TaxID=1892596 RepID=UPI000845D7B0|nr:YdcH family protein [Neptunicoccus sediminis]
MSMSSHISELKRKHEELSQRVETFQRRPGMDDLEIASLKKEKLRLKEEINRLSN